MSNLENQNETTEQAQDVAAQETATEETTMENAQAEAETPAEEQEAPRPVITIAKAMSRLKVIKAQMDKIGEKIGEGGAWSSKHVHPFGESRIVDTNLNQASQYVNSMFQSFQDLGNEYLALKRAIDRTNMETIIEVNGKRLSIYDGLIIKHHLKDKYQDLLRKYSGACRNAEKTVDRFNSQYASATEEAKKVLLAQVVYFINQKQVDNLDYFVLEFIQEIDDAINAANNVTPIIL